MFARAGFADTSVKSVARAAKVGHGTVFLHFLDKAQLYGEVIQLAGDRFLTRMCERTSTTCGTLAETLEGWVRELARCDDASMLLRMGNRTNRRPAISAAARSVELCFVHFWRLRLESWFDAPPDGSERLEELARLIVFTAWGFAEARLGGKRLPETTVAIEDFASVIEIMAGSRQNDGCCRG